MEVQPFCGALVGLHHLVEPPQLAEGSYLMWLGLGKADFSSALERQQTIPIALLLREHKARKGFLISRTCRLDLRQCS